MESALASPKLSRFRSWNDQLSVVHCFFVFPYSFFFFVMVFYGTHLFLGDCPRMLCYTTESQKQAPERRNYLNPMYARKTHSIVNTALNYVHLLSGSFLVTSFHNLYPTDVTWHSYYDFLRFNWYYFVFRIHFMSFDAAYIRVLALVLQFVQRQPATQSIRYLDFLRSIS